MVLLMRIVTRAMEVEHSLWLHREAICPLLVRNLFGGLKDLLLPLVS